jgi:hypothetical protein
MEIMKLDIILRTCDGPNVHNDWRVRYCDMEKIDLIKGCVNSLILSINNLKNIDVNLTILDDHSSQNFIDWIKDRIAGTSYNLVQLEDKGYNNSALKQFEMCKNSTADYVYSVEDDYLHVPSALQEMIASYEIFKSKLKKDKIVMYPFDAPEEYDPPKEQCFLVHGSNRHWRTGIFTTNVMLTVPKLFQDHWELFEILATKYNGDYVRKMKENEIRITEGNTIWQIWASGEALRFNPVPSLALHMQFDRQIDPFINWKSWWNDYTK